MENSPTQILQHHLEMLEAQDTTSKTIPREYRDLLYSQIFKFRQAIEKLEK